MTAVLIESRVYWVLVWCTNYYHTRAAQTYLLYLELLCLCSYFCHIVQAMITELPFRLGWLITYPLKIQVFCKWHCATGQVVLGIFKYHFGFKLSLAQEIKTLWSFRTLRITRPLRLHQISENSLFQQHCCENFAPNDLLCCYKKYW